MSLLQGKNSRRLAGAYMDLVSTRDKGKASNSAQSVLRQTI